MGGSSSPPKETASDAAMRNRQILDLTSLDAQANVIRKRSLRGRSGARAFRTSALDRAGGGLFGSTVPRTSGTTGPGVGQSVNSPGTTGSAGIGIIETSSGQFLIPGGKSFRPYRPGG